MPKFQATFLEQMQAYQKQENILPAKISLIWIGSDIPNTSERPYLENAMKHKKFSPQSTVSIFVNEGMLRASNKWDSLIATCKEHGVELRDIEKSCSSYINYDIVMELMKNPKDYVWASDVLRLSLMFHEGGKYFDTDITPQRREQESACEQLPFGFNLYYPAERGGQVPEPGYLAGVPQHFIYFYSSMFARYLYEHVQIEIAISPVALKWLESQYAVVRQKAICELSGCCTSQFIYYTSLGDLYGHSIVDCRWKGEENYTIKHDHTWLDGLIDFEKDKNISESEKAESDAQIDAYRCFISRVREKITGDEFFIRMGEMYSRSSSAFIKPRAKVLGLMRELEKQLNNLRDSVSELNQQGYVLAATAAQELSQTIEFRYKDLLSSCLDKEEKTHILQQCKKAINDARPGLETYPPGKLILTYLMAALTGIGAFFALADAIYTLTAGEHLMFFKTSCAKEATSLNDTLSRIEHQNNNEIRLE